MVAFACKGLHFRALFTKHKGQINDCETTGYQVICTDLGLPHEMGS